MHNLHRLDRGRPDAGFDWAVRFDERVRRLLLGGEWEALLSLDRDPDHALAAPTSERLLPLLYRAGLAEAAGEPPEVLVDGYAYGSLSMTSLTLGAPGLGT
ncbi:MAG: hypothetical protein IPM45_03715 [Acidimicrobiales bacterium]|nr:hypothetical protein [Acidimicrobiales bacterium]